MRLPKSLYIYVMLLLGVGLWDLLLITPVFNPNTIPVFILLWALFGIFHYNNLPEEYNAFDFSPYRKYYIWFFSGLVFSVVPAYFFWGQDIISSLIVNRGLIIYIFMPVLLFIKPTDKEIMNGVLFFTITYMVVWLAQAVLVPIPITVTFLEKVKSGAPFEIDPTDFGMLLPGYTLIVLLLYLKLQQFMQSSVIKTLIPALVMFVVIFLLQNRGTLFFSAAVMLYVILKMKSRFKPYILLAFGIAAMALIYKTADSWLWMIQETRQQAGDMDYNRWKAFNFFVFEFSPDWLCYIFGNGRFSFHSDAGASTFTLALEGYDQSDIGMIGFWSIYGIIPVAVIIILALSVVFRKEFPMYLKAISLHILLIPIAWNFAAADALVLILLFYLFAYYSESYKLLTNETS